MKKDMNLYGNYQTINDSEFSDGGFKTLCEKRRSTEEYHNSMKYNVLSVKSSASTVTAQTNHYNMNY